MPIVLNGSGTVTGISAGGLPDGIIQAADLASGVGGKILQVVSTTKTDTTSISSSDFANITGMSVSITPSSSSNKIFIIGYVCISLTNFQKRVYLKITGGNAANYIGAAATGIEAANVAVLRVNTNYGQLNSPLQYLDSPNTTSAITYQVQWASEGGVTGYLNRPVTQDSVGANVASTITAMEVAA
tara:strand:- start:50 stop:607 length:558 start_codon:yes stop_codon:yes gene_type:complete